MSKLIKINIYVVENIELSDGTSKNVVTTNVTDFYINLNKILAIKQVDLDENIKNTLIFIEGFGEPINSPFSVEDVVKAMDSPIN